MRPSISTLRDDSSPCRIDIFPLWDMSIDAGSMVMPNVEDGLVEPALRTDPSDAL